MNIQDAVNNALDDIELVENPRFIDLMTALYDDIVGLCEYYNYVEEFKEAYDAIGEFVPTDTANND